MIGIAALAIGIVLGLVFHPSVPEVVQPYLPIAVVAALDAVFGGLRAYLERIFGPKVFVISFVFNVFVAALIVYVGDQLGVGTQLSTAIIVVLGIRIPDNPVRRCAAPGCPGCCAGPFPVRFRHPGRAVVSAAGHRDRHPGPPDRIGGLAGDGAARGPVGVAGLVAAARGHAQRRGERTAEHAEFASGVRQ
ncbi:hypothetical protein MLM_2328 [Mycobacterium lepraemurium]|nr:hypothetical protein MLM_2328 [Mycobacterium lepraemurium]